MRKKNKDFHQMSHKNKTKQNKKNNLKPRIIRPVHCNSPSIVYQN